MPSVNKTVSLLLTMIKMSIIAMYSYTYVVYCIQNPFTWRAWRYGFIFGIYSQSAAHSSMFAMCGTAKSRWFRSFQPHPLPLLISACHILNGSRWSFQGWIDLSGLWFFSVRVDWVPSRQYTVYAIRQQQKHMAPKCQLLAKCVLESLNRKKYLLAYENFSEQ